MNFPRRIAIVAHLPHYKFNEWKSYEPYVREIYLWADLFDEITIYTEVVTDLPKFALKKLPNNCNIRPIFLKSGPGLLNNLIRLVQLPIVFIQVIVLYFSFDIIHTRTSGFSTMFINFLNFIFNKPTIEKWATNFPPDKKLGYFSKLHSKILYYSPKNTKILVYSKVEKENFIRSFPALFSKEELAKFKNGSDLSKWDVEKKQYVYVCVSRLHIDKNVQMVIEAISILNHIKKVKINLVIIGDGPEKEKLINIAEKLNVTQFIDFKGSLSFDEVMFFLQKSNFLIMPGINEGWGKVINEALATNCIPLVVKGGNSELILKDMGTPGLLFKQTPESLAEIIIHTQDLNIDLIRKYLDLGHEANEGMTLEAYKEKIVAILNGFDFK